VPGNRSKLLPPPWRHLLLHVAFGALWIQCAISPAFAQNPTGTHVEVWYGMRRIDAQELSQPEIAKPIKPPRPPLPLPAKKEGRVAVPELTPSRPNQAPTSVMAVPVHMPSPPLAAPASRAMEQAKAPGTSVSHDQTNSIPMPSPLSAPPDSPANSPRGVLPAGEAAYGVAPAPLLCALIAAIASPLLGALSFWLLLRRYSRAHGSPFRIDFSSPPIYGVPVPSASSTGLPAFQPDTAPRDVARSPDRATTGMHVIPDAPVAATTAATRTAEVFDPGPSYAAVAQQQQDALRRHEEGILRYLVDQNVELMEQIHG
jgi:hypothetical protein